MTDIYNKYFPPKWSFVHTFPVHIFWQKVYMFENKIFWSLKREIFCSFQDRGIQRPILVNFLTTYLDPPPPLCPEPELYELDPRLLYSVLFSPCVGFFSLFTLGLAQTLFKMYTLSNWHSYLKNFFWICPLLKSY